MFNKVLEMKKIEEFILFLMLFISVSCVNKSSNEKVKEVDTIAVDTNSSGKVVITDVYNGDVGRDIYYDTEQEKNILFIRDNNYQFTVLDKTENNEWIIVEKTPVIVDEGRVETEHLLFNIPSAKEINVADIDSSLSSYVISFKKENGVEYVITSTKYGEKEVLVPLKILLPIVSIKFGVEEDQIGKGMLERKVNDGDNMDAIPSFAVCNGQIYIIDAINFRLLVFDYSGKFIKRISYPNKSENGKWNVIKDICVDKGVVYLLSSSDKSIYVLDSETEDVIDKITGVDTDNKKFGSISEIRLDHKGNLVIPDTWDNSLYVYGRLSNSYKRVSTTPYIDKNQLIFDSNGKNYTTKSDSGNVVVCSSSGSAIGSFNYKLKVGGSTIIGTDKNNNIYIKTSESDEPGAQFPKASYIKVISQNGTLLNNIKVDPWAGGPITKDIIVDENGNIFITHFKEGETPDSLPAEFYLMMAYK